MLRIFTGFFLLVLLLSGCGGESGKPAGDGKINIVATIGMITDIVEQVGGEKVSAIGLMGPGVDPHLYKASEGDVNRMAQADILFYNGLHLEGAMSEVLHQMNRRVKTVAVTELIDESLFFTPPQFKGSHDPHVWFDVTMWMSAVESVKRALIEYDSTSAEYFSDNAANLQVRLDSLHQYIKQQAQRVPTDKRVLITAHDAFNYFGRAYGFEVRGLQGISTAAEAGTADVQQLSEFIANRKIPAIFVESSVPPRNIEAVQAAVRSRGFDVQIGGELFSDAMGNRGTFEGTYIGMVKHNIDIIVSALLGESKAEVKH